MNFFSIDDTTNWTWVANFWMFFAFTAPITFAGLVLFMFEVNVVGWIRRKFSKPVKDWYSGKRRNRRMRALNRDLQVQAQVNTNATPNGQPGGVV